MIESENLQDKIFMKPVVFDLLVSNSKPQIKLKFNIVKVKLGQEINFMVTSDNFYDSDNKENELSYEFYFI
jgi:hypothetical protein